MSRRFPRPRILPMALVAMAGLSMVKLERLVHGVPATATNEVSLVASARASGPAPRATTPATPAQAPATAPAPAAEPPSAESQAERALLEGLRARRATLDEREQALAAREMVLAATERRLAQRVDELAAMQRRLETADRARSEREEAGWRQLVKLYEGMRPRDAAAIFDDLEMSVLVQVVERMREAKAAPVLGAMRPERARQLTAELARSRARPAGE